MINLLSPHSALDILQFGQNLQVKSVSLTSDPAASVHVVPQSQHQPQHTLHPSALQQGLQTSTTTENKTAEKHTHNGKIRGQCLSDHWSYPADSGDGVELALGGQHSVGEGRPEDDALGSARKVRDLRQLVQEPGAQAKAAKITSEFLLFLSQL